MKLKQLLSGGTGNLPSSNRSFLLFGKKEPKKRSPCRTANRLQIFNIEKL